MASTSTELLDPAMTVTESFPATGGWFLPVAGVTVTLTVAWAVPPAPSLTVYVNESGPV